MNSIFISSLILCALIVFGSIYPIYLKSPFKLHEQPTKSQLYGVCGRFTAYLLLMLAVLILAYFPEVYFAQT